MFYAEKMFQKRHLYLQIRLKKQQNCPNIDCRPRAFSQFVRKWYINN